jgi:hypothetical protein
MARMSAWSGEPRRSFRAVQRWSGPRLLRSAQGGRRRPSELRLGWRPGPPARSLPACNSVVVCRSCTRARSTPERLRPSMRRDAVRVSWDPLLPGCNAPGTPLVTESRGRGRTRNATRAGRQSLGVCAQFFDRDNRLSWMRSLLADGMISIRQRSEVTPGHASSRLVRSESPAPRHIERWWAWMDSNHRPADYESAALTS